VTAPVTPHFGDKQALAAFVVDNADLDALEAQLEQFNLFEALGVVRRELTHSNVLAFLIDPSQNHGLDDALARKLLQRALLLHPKADAPVSPIDLDLWPLAGLRVRREWRDIDLLLVDEARRLVVAIENKIDSREHSDQLRRYRGIVEEHFPGFRRLFLYLTPDGNAPSDDAYLAVGYRVVADAVEAVAASSGEGRRRGGRVDGALRPHAQEVRRGRFGDHRALPPDLPAASACDRPHYQARS
jgi:hypothetical protein